MKKIAIMLLSSALVLASCQSAPSTSLPPQPEQATAQPSLHPTEAPTLVPTLTSVPTEPLSPVLLATMRYTEPLKVVAEKDISYTKPLQAEVTVQKLDIYHPEGAGPWPVVLLLPRMSPNRGSLAYVNLSKLIAGQGIMVVIPDYGTMDIYFPLKAAENNGRLFRQTHEEIVCALSYIASNATRYGGNPKNVILVGHDTGGLYAMDVVLLGEKLQSAWDAFAAKRGGPPPQAQCLAESQPAKVNALVSYAGQFFYMSDLNELDADLSALIDPLALIKESTGTKISLMTIMNDPDYPVEPTVKVKEALEEAGYQVDFFPLYTASTNIKSSGPELEWIVNAIMQYVKQ